MGWSAPDFLSRWLPRGRTLISQDVPDSPAETAPTKSSISRALSIFRSPSIMASSATVHPNPPSESHTHLPAALSAPEQECKQFASAHQAPEDLHALLPTVIAQHLPMPRRLPALSRLPAASKRDVVGGTTADSQLQAPTPRAQTPLNAAAASPVQIVDLSKRDAGRQVECPCCKHRFFAPELPPQRTQNMLLPSAATPKAAVSHGLVTVAPDQLTPSMRPLLPPPPGPLHHDWDTWSPPTSGRAGGDSPGEPPRLRNATSAPVNVLSVQPQVVRELQARSKATSRAALRKSAFSESLSRCESSCCCSAA